MYEVYLKFRVNKFQGKFIDFNDITDDHSKVVRRYLLIFNKVYIAILLSLNCLYTYLFNHKLLEFMMCLLYHC